MLSLFPDFKFRSLINLSSFDHELINCENCIFETQVNISCPTCVTFACHVDLMMFWAVAILGQAYRQI